MKVLYHIGDHIGSETMMKKGVMDEHLFPLSIQSDDFIKLDRLKSVEIYKLSSGCTFLKILNGNETIYLTVPRIYIESGNGFVIVNYFATKKLKRILESSLS